MQIMPIYKEIDSDFETPVSAFLKLTDNNAKTGFLLESKEKVEDIGRYSLMGVFSNKYLKFDSDPFDKLKKILNSIEFKTNGLPTPFSGGLIGYFSYDTIKYIEDLELKNPDNINIPESLFVLPEIYMVFDHFLNKGFLFVLVNDTDKDNDYSYNRETGKSILDYYEKKFSSQISIDEVKPGATKKSVKLFSNFSKDDYESIVKKA